MTDVLGRLQRWFADACNGTWEHELGIRIETLDNPGWSVKLDLSGTALDGKNFDEVEVNRSETDWIKCRVKNGRFEGAGGAQNLDEILGEFVRWIGPDLVGQ